MKKDILIGTMMNSAYDFYIDHPRVLDYAAALTLSSLSIGAKYASISLNELSLGKTQDILVDIAQSTCDQVSEKAASLAVKVLSSGLQGLRLE